MGSPLSASQDIDWPGNPFYRLYGHGGRVSMAVLRSQFSPADIFYKVVRLTTVASDFPIDVIKGRAGWPGLRRVPDLPSFMQYAVVGRYLRRL